MNTDKEEADCDRNARERVLSERVIGCAFRVANTLGVGFLEKVYENALCHELLKNGLSVFRQFPLAVRYDGVVVGEYTADLLVEKTLLIELKSVPAVVQAHIAQCLNYLRATDLHICLLLNFGAPRLEIKRVVI